MVTGNIDFLEGWLGLPPGSLGRDWEWPTTRDALLDEAVRRVSGGDINSLFDDTYLIHPFRFRDESVAGIRAEFRRLVEGA